MRKNKLIALFVCVIIAMLVCLSACSSGTVASQSSTSSEQETSSAVQAESSSVEESSTSAEEVTQASMEGEEIIRSDAWRSVYPYIFTSMAEGAQNKEGDTRPHTHNQAELIKNTEDYLLAYPEWYPDGLTSSGTSYCISCRHGADFKAVYDEDPEGVWGLS